MAPRKQQQTKITNDHSAGVCAFSFYQEIQKFQQVKSDFEKTKKKVNALFEEYFQACGTKKMVFDNPEDDSLQGGMITVTRVQNTKIHWDLKKLKENISRKVFNQVVTKSYTIIDFNGLVEYLKSCGVDPRVFKKYISVDCKVNESEIDRLSEIGEISQSDIDGCYKISKSNPYFKYSYKASGDE